MEMAPGLRPPAPEMEMTPGLALLRRLRELQEDGERSSKKIRAEEDAAVRYEAPPAAVAEKKKTKMVTVSKEQVELVLAIKPKIRWHAREGSLPPQTTCEERRRQSAWVDEIFSSNNEIIRRLQENYRHQLATKGFVQVEVEVTGDES